MNRLSIFALAVGLGVTGVALSLDKIERPKPQSPGVEHELLAPLVGEFTTESKVYFGPEEKPEIGKGHTSHKWVLGKRFVEIVTESESSHGTMEGIGFVGYDIVNKKYVANWMDNFATSIIAGEGNAEGKNLAITYTCPDARTGKMKKSRSLWKLDNPDRIVLEMFEMTDAGKETKVLEVFYTRVK